MTDRPSDENVARLVRFARAVIEASLNDDLMDWAAGDLVGDLQGWAEECGLIERVPGGYDPEKHGERNCEPGDTWYRTKLWLDELP